MSKETVQKIFEYQSKTYLYPVIFVLRLLITKLDFDIGVASGSWATDEKTSATVDGIVKHSGWVLGLVLVKAGLDILIDYFNK